MGHTLKNIFNWMAEKPSSQFTLGGESHSFKFNRAARFVERVTTIPAVAVGVGIALFGVPAALVGAAPVAASALVVGAAVAAFGKAAGLVKGGIVHLAAKGLSSLSNRLAQPKNA
jgi:urease alpha subunit